ncbi:hypothetical protein IMAU80053_02747 [Lactiplantibacillus plantarum]|uniref:hypothetical protein n=1 Tax=Lactiplantibacillus plantarum TaxID=1590 RepID=UPI0007BC30A2|nr:hypothetical protein [Lactiplantibacillus plantarum]KZU55199.1 hypothetical protein Nizo2802_1097 [Lactiplantibacillus plantarum]MCG0668893.1 hypothetical protein [Lactiplantibacillus plantarum]MDI5785586.1 hypothetical protein [Lactiplantibacillus plantarum]QIL58109.1 hypothetical protein EPJ55_10910 [Lactiplantibacillus plantarum]
MQENEELMKYTMMAMKGLVMDEESIQANKIMTDTYMICFNEAITKGNDVSQAHIIATNILTAMYKGNN